MQLVKARLYEARRADRHRYAASSHFVSKCQRTALCESTLLPFSLCVVVVVVVAVFTFTFSPRPDRTNSKLDTLGARRGRGGVRIKLMMSTNSGCQVKGVPSLAKEVTRESARWQTRIDANCRRASPSTRQASSAFASDWLRRKTDGCARQQLYNGIHICEQQTADH